jgi:hypothetical protein
MSNTIATIVARVACWSFVRPKPQSQRFECRDGVPRWLTVHTWCCLFRQKAKCCAPKKYCAGAAIKGFQNQSFATSFFHAVIVALERPCSFSGTYVQEQHYTYIQRDDSCRLHFYNRKPFFSVKQANADVQGCQMVYFLTKNRNLDQFCRALQWEVPLPCDVPILCPFVIFCGNLV